MSSSDDEGGGIEPVSDGRTITFKPKILNEFLTCTICRGYFRDPVTVRECLHTFCKSCCYKYIVDNAGPSLGCPDCGVALGSRPFDSVKEDCVLHELVIKIFPQVFEQDKEDERRFYEYIGRPIDGGDVYETTSLTKRTELSGRSSPPPAKKAKTNSSSEVQIKLEYSDNGASDSKFKQLNKPVLTISSNATILHLKKFIQNELSLDNTDCIEILFDGEVLGSEHSIDFILRTRSSDSSRAVFTFQKRS
mmetsp:Transcript_2706/g.4394  ORF Transcript_2706/g.4394 Transcript_2706/m.4394 type:complete len:249 (+) Transcript_2706:21-767(+)